MILPSEYIKKFELICFDMSKTFMFGSDQFTPKQDYEAIYTRFGGRNLNNEELHEIIYYTYGKLLERSRDKEHYDNMLNVEEFIESDDYFSKYSAGDKILIERVFANQECGTVPVSCKETLLQLSKTHKLCVISNVWCKSLYFTEQLKKDGVFELFDLIVYSCDHKTVKPSPKIFNIAINHFQVSKDKIVHVGDNYKRDVIGAKNVGLSSILVNNSEASIVTGEIQPDMIISEIEELA